MLLLPASKQKSFVKMEAVGYTETFCCKGGRHNLERGHLYPRENLRYFIRYTAILNLLTK